MTRSEKRGRIRRWTLFAAALASFSFAARTVAAEIPSGEEKISVSLSWLDSYGLCPLALRTAEAESDAILKRMGVLADSESSSNGPGDSTIRFRAALLDVEPDAWGLDRSAFGAVRGRDVLPDEVFVFTGNVVRVTGHRADDCRVARKQREIGRALARIVVHALVHVVAPEHPHADEGLMMAHISREWLLEPLNGFDRSCVEAFAAALADRASPTRASGR